MDFVLVQTGTGCEAAPPVPGGGAVATKTRQQQRSPPRDTTQTHERRPFGGTGDNHARIMQELRHRMQDLERRLADREHDQRTLEQSPTSSRSRSRSRRTPSPQYESESTGGRGRARRRTQDPIIYARRERRCASNRGDEDVRRENVEPRRTTQGPVIIGATPFHRSVLEVRLPKHFDKPTDVKYDGTQDPLEHLTAFEARMNLEGVGDEVRCRAFPVTLAGPAIRWFNNLPQGSVTQFSDISHAFLAQFTTRIVKAKHPINLLGVTQRAGEPTRKYLDRFNDECLEIDGLTDSVASLCLTNGLLNEDFRKHLTTKPVWTMQEIQCVAKEYINDEKVSRVVAANKRQPVYNQTRHYESRERPKEHARDGGPEKGILSRPRPLKDRTGGNKNLYCDYHKGYGHKTQDCFDLKDALEQAIRDGKLADFSHLIREPRRRNRDHDSEDRSQSTRRRQEPEGDDHGLTVVNVVTARNTAPRSKSAQKKDAKVLAVSSSSARSSRGLPSISFSPEDQWFDEVPESPPMVITARIGTGLVKRILGHRRRTVMADFVILRDSTAFNIILGRKTINDLGAAISTKLLVMKFVADDRSVGSIRGDLETAVACDHASLSLRKKSKEASGIFLADLDARIDDKPRPEPEGDLEKFRVGEEDDKFTFINRNLPHEIKEPLMEMIRANADLFAWTPADMPGIDPQLMSHHLAVKTGAKPVAQRRRKMSQERAEEVARQTSSLLEAGFIRELDYSTWLSNVVLVKKHNGRWRMCVDYSDLNKACPKDCYPLPNIDALVDAAAGYRVMPFGLKNAGATYQRLMNKIFSELIGKTVEVYVDDILAKTARPDDLLSDLDGVFASLRQHGMRLNPLKCAFAMEAGKFLGFMITQRGVEANPEKCQAVLQMKSPGCIKDVQRLAGRLTALSRFLGASAARALPFFNLMRKGIAFEWTPACEEAFNHFKEILATPPVLGKPKAGESLYLYLSITEEALATVLVREEGKTQQPVYFVSRALQGPELREVREGCCGHHIGGKALARKLIRAGYYWPSMMKDSKEFVKRCIKCQQNTNFHKAPASELSSLTTTRPFGQWGVDLLGPFPVGPGQVKYLIVAIDYYTKWVKAEPLATISSSNCRKFMWRQVITRFGIPEVVISDNGTQFTDKKFTEFLSGLGIKQRFSSVEHPQTNGQVEAANKIILLGLKKRLDNKKGAWADELASVLWSYRTTEQSATGETPFRLTYGVDAVIPVEIGEPSPRLLLAGVNETVEKDLVEETREMAHLSETSLKQRIALHYNTKFLRRDFEERDLVLRRNDVGTPTSGREAGGELGRSLQN
ncbi:uncharacterized protein [Arachis hypogaea]|uniref:uncharacterized protein n=1 Tax=Arachis hypogaea TaxID=3818 RepID=UPI003B22813C